VNKRSDRLPEQRRQNTDRLCATPRSRGSCAEARQVAQFVESPRETGGTDALIAFLDFWQDPLMALAEIPQAC
jgi:hypothetical protein